MKTSVAAALCLIAVAPAWAQQGQPSQAPHVASPTGTSAPPADPFKNAGRPESHGGATHSPQLGGTSQPPSADVRGAIEALSRTTVTAQQYGNLASMRHASGAAHELGDRMTVTNSRINKALSAAHPDLRGTERMPADERATFDNVARRANEAEFGVSLAQWVSENYPRMIETLERLGKEGQFQELATTALPELRAQLANAGTILQTASTDPSQVQAKQPSSATGTIPREGSAKRSD